MLVVMIQHSPWDEQRRAWVIEQRRRIPCAEVVEDTCRSGSWPTYREAWLKGLLRAEREGKTHVLVLTDDMVPCPNFCELASGAVSARPDMPISFFSMRRCIREALEDGLHWVQINDGFWGGASLLPAADIAAFLRWETETIDPDYRSADRRVAAWILETGRCVNVTAPSLLEHAGAAHSTIGNSNWRRHATAFATGRPIDWKTEALRASGTLPKTELRKMRRAA
jgi:hypothetical protein